MPTEMKLWRIENERPSLLPQQKLNLESRLEEWLMYDIGLIRNDLLVIGNQVETAYGGFIDLIAIDPVGNLVILELKRDKTPRDIVAQALDYASWVRDLGHDSVKEISMGFFKDKDLEQAFREKFDIDLPEVVNERHRIYIVASTLDAATERIVKYLSETHNLDINIATFAYFKADTEELLGRSLLLDETDVQARAESSSKRQSPRSWEELREIAEKNGVVELYDRALSELRSLHDSANRTRANVAFVGYMGVDKARSTTIGLYPEASFPERGLALMVYVDNLCKYFSLSEEKIITVLGPPAMDAGTWKPSYTWFFDEQRLEELVNLLSQAKRQ